MTLRSPIQSMRTFLESIDPLGASGIRAPPRDAWLSHRYSLSATFRSTVEVASLPLGSLYEIEAIASV